jgi:hypothetical protein
LEVETFHDFEGSELIPTNIHRASQKVLVRRKSGKHTGSLLASTILIKAEMKNCSKKFKKHTTAYRILKRRNYTIKAEKKPSNVAAVVVVVTMISFRRCLAAVAVEGNLAALKRENLLSIRSRSALRIYTMEKPSRWPFHANV